MANLFRSELIMPYAKSGFTTGIGEWTTRNGVPAMDIRPVPFYMNLDGGTNSGILRNELRSGVSYIIDMWIDVDDVVYNGNNVAAGFQAAYSDGTSESFVFTGNHSSPIGFQHKRIITPTSKNLNRLVIYYYTSVPVYYRWDSYVSPVNTTGFEKSGIIRISDFIENQSQTSIFTGGDIHGKSFYEY